MALMGEDEEPRGSGEQLLWKGRTHFKILFKPALIQLLLIVLHVLVAVYIPRATDWLWWDNWGQLTLQSILLFLSLLYVIIPLLRWRNATFELTDKRVIKHWGILYRHSREIPLDRIASVSVERGILDRIFGCGTLNFQDNSSVVQETRGSWNRARDNKNLQGVRFYDVPRVLEVKRLIDSSRYNAS